MRVRNVAVVVFAAVLVGSCSRKLTPADDTATDTDTDTESDTDTDADTDTDTDADTDTDTDTSLQAECTPSNPDYTTPVQPSGCTTTTISCGDQVKHTTVGGGSYFDAAEYDAWFCQGTWGAAQNWNAPERVYEFTLESGSVVDIRLYANCGDLALRAVRSTSDCPLSAHQVVCQAAQVDGDEQVIHLSNPSSAPDYRYEFIVDGRGGASENYILEVDCQ